MHLFTADGFTGKLIECQEGDLQWISKEKLLSLPMWEGDKIFLNLLFDPEQPFFSLNRSKTYKNLCKGRNAAVSAANFSIQHQWWISAVHHK